MPLLLFSTELPWFQVFHEPLYGQIGNCLQSPRLFKEVCCAANYLKPLVGLELRISALIKLDYGRIHLSDNEECGSRHLRQ